MKNASIQPDVAQYKALDGQVSIDEARGIVECFVAAVGNKDSVGDVVLPGAFNSSLKRRKPRVVWGHNWNEPIGKVLEIYEVGPSDPRLPAKMRQGGVGGLYAKVQFNLKSERGREAFANVSFFGHEQEWSIGYKTLDAVFDPAQNANLLKEVELYEVSPVLHGANQLTGTISIKTAKQPLKDPKGGLTAAGRAHFKKTEGANLKPGVKGPADTPQKMRRKGSFLTRFFTNPRGPMKDAKGRPTRLALSAAAWGEPVPQDRSDAAKLAAKGRRLLERYENAKQKSDGADIQTKNHISDVYAANIVLARPQDAARQALTEAVSRHFGGPCRIMYADQNMIVAEMRRDGVNSTLRIPYHRQNNDFMFGTSEEVMPQVVYVPTTPNAPAHAFGWEGSPEKRDGGCGCDSCGKPMPSWDSFKEHNPGKHLFVHSADDLGLFAAINDLSDEKSVDIELLEVGVAIKNIDQLDDETYNNLIEAIDDFEEKAIGATIGRARRGVRGALERFDPDAVDADMDRIVQEGTPYERPDARIRKPVPARMMPAVPREKPVPEKVPEPVPERQPAPTKPPVKPPIPTPSRPVPSPVRPTVPAGLSGRMSGTSPREVFESRMGGETLDQAAARLKTTRQKVRQMEQGYIAQLRKREELANKLGEALRALDSVAFGFGAGDGETQLDDDTAAMFWQTMATLRGEWEPATMKKDGYRYSHAKAIAAMRKTADKLQRSEYYGNPKKWNWQRKAADLFRKAADLHKQVVAQGSYKKFREPPARPWEKPIRNMPELDKFRPTWVSPWVLHSNTPR